MILVDKYIYSFYICLLKLIRTFNCFTTHTHTHTHTHTRTHTHTHTHTQVYMVDGDCDQFIQDSNMREY